MSNLDENTIVLNQENEIIEETEQTKKIIVSDEQREDGVSYTKTKKISFSVKGLKFNEIPVLKSIRLSFYEKYSILLLKKGIVAKNKYELVSKVSSLLNVSLKCIDEFIEYLAENDYLFKDRKSSLYYLNPSINFIIDKKLDNAMFAELDVQPADCNKIVFIDGIEMFYLEEDFVKDIFKRKGSSATQNELTVPQRISLLVNQNGDVLEPLFRRYFSSTNLHLKNDFTYKLIMDSYFDYQFEFEVMLEYKYFKNLKKSLYQNVIVLKDNFLPESFISRLVKPYEEDDKLPRFISLDEELYQKIIPSSDAINAVVDEIELTKVKVEPIEEEVKDIKSQLSELKKKYNKKKKEETDNKDSIQLEINQCDEEIKESETLIDSQEETDNELIANLKKTIKALKNSKKELTKKLEEKEEEIESLNQDYQNKEEELKSQLTVKEEEIKVINTSIKEQETQYNTLVKEHKELINKNEKKLHKVIQDTLDKYPATKNILNGYINNICVLLDKALSASENEAFDECWMCIDQMRQLYRNLLQTFFEVTLEKNGEKLATFLSPLGHLLAIDNLFKKRKVPMDIRTKIVAFDTFASAVGHRQEKGSKRAENIQRMEDFKKSSLSSRESLLLAIPLLFLNFELTKKEINALITKLKI